MGRGMRSAQKEGRGGKVGTTATPMSKQELETLLTPADVAERCQVSPKTVIRAIRAGRLRAYRLGARGAYRLRAADVEAWLAESQVEPVVVPFPVRAPVPLRPLRSTATHRGKLRVPRSRA